MTVIDLKASNDMRYTAMKAKADLLSTAITEAKESLEQLEKELAAVEALWIKENLDATN